MINIGPPPTPDEMEAPDSKPPTTTEPSMSRAPMRVGRLTKIQAALGLPVQTLAEVLNIAPAQLYKWLDADNDLALQDENLQRLALLTNLARDWRARSNQPLSRVGAEPLAGGGTVIALLTARHIDSSAVACAFDELARKLAYRGKSASQRMAEAGFARRPSHRSLPSDE